MIASISQDKIWFAIIKDKKSKIKGSFYLCLTSEEIHLYKIHNESNLKEREKRLSSSSDKSVEQIVAKNSNSDKNESAIITSQPTPNKLTSKEDAFSMEVFRFPFSLIRSFGHQSNKLFIHLGRSSDIGSCQLWFELKDCDTSQYIHSLVASTRAAAKNEFRTRSNSENNRTLSKRNKSLSDKQNQPNLSSSLNSHSKITSINQNSKSSSSLKFSNNLKAMPIPTGDNSKRNKNENENSTEYVVSPVAYSSVFLGNNNVPMRSRSTSESSTAHSAQRGFQSLFRPKKPLNHQSSNSNIVSNASSNHVISNESIQSIDSNEDKDSDYYMSTPNDVQPSACSIKEEDYLMVDDSSFTQPSPQGIPSEESTIQLSSSDELKLVAINDPLANKLVQQSSIENVHYKYHHYSPANNGFVELPDPVVEEESNDCEQVDEYIQVEFGANKKLSGHNRQSEQKSKLAVISSEPSSTSDSSKTTPTANANEHQPQLNLEEDEDYIGIESFSSTATTNTATNNQETENFEVNNLSPISSASFNTNRVKTFSMSSNNTSNNELNSLGTSPLMSNVGAFYNIPIFNHGKEEVYKLEKVKSYFNSTEDCGDYIKPARTYSMGSRPQLQNHHKFRTTSHCSAMTKSNTLNGPTLSNNQSLINHTTKKGKLVY